MSSPDKRPDGTTAPSKGDGGKGGPQKDVAFALAYGGRGHITRAQAPRFGHQLFDIMFPF